MASEGIQFVFDDPTTLNPLFVVQQAVCAYPISDLWATAPRYLYYILLVLTIVVQRCGWLANVFLGVCAAYAGVAALEVFVIAGAYQGLPPSEIVTIPRINSTAQDATTLGLLKGNTSQYPVMGIVTNTTRLPITPYVYENDTDALTVVLITGFLAMLPMHIWCSVVKQSRARRLLMMIWNVLMLAGSCCTIFLWRTMAGAPPNYRFCYPGYLDSNQTTADDFLDLDLGRADWNTTVWNTFSNLTVSGGILGFSCLNPCFNTTQIMRRPSTIISSLDVNRSFRTKELDISDYEVSDGKVSDTKVLVIMGFIIIFILFTIGVALVLLLFGLTPLQKYTRVPVSQPGELFSISSRRRGELLRGFWTDIRRGVPWFCGSTNRADGGRKSRLRRFLGFWLDMSMIGVLLYSCIATPAMIVCFVVGMEWWIRRSFSTDETLHQVGQWSVLASLGLVLISAMILELKCKLATTSEVDEDIKEAQERLKMLQDLKQQKMQPPNTKTRKSVSNADLELEATRYKQLNSTEQI